VSGASSFPSGSLDSADPRWNRNAVRMTYAAICRKLALPVLEDRGGEVAAPKILQQSERRTAML
jgi:hypothetical protein